MRDIGKRFLWVSAYAIAMALLEAVVVVYIRGLLRITNDHVALGSYMTMETWREAATLVMLAAVGWLAGHKRLDRWAYGWFAFGMWDIGYYVWLKVLIDWPASLLSLDTLFLIPLTWWGPVLAPMLIAALMCVVAVLAVVLMERGEAAQFRSARGEVVLPCCDLEYPAASSRRRKRTPGASAAGMSPSRTCRRVPPGHRSLRWCWPGS